MPDEEWFPSLVGPLYEVERPLKEFVLDRLHAFACNRASILAALPADAAPARLLGGIVFCCCLTVKKTPWSELFDESGDVMRILRILGLFLGIQVIKAAKEFVEPVHRGQEFIVEGARNETH